MQRQWCNLYKTEEKEEQESKRKICTNNSAIIFCAPVNPPFSFHLAFISGGTAIHFSSNESSSAHWKEMYVLFLCNFFKRIYKKSRFMLFGVFAICFKELGSHAVTFPALSVKYDERDSLTSHIIPSSLQR